jgi:hypothetical protein
MKNVSQGHDREKKEGCGQMLCKGKELRVGNLWYLLLLEKILLIVAGATILEDSRGHPLVSFPKIKEILLAEGAFLYYLVIYDCRSSIPRPDDAPTEYPICCRIYANA